jgi:secondary thiamine-phosphate synthase enzyme
VKNINVKTRRRCEMIDITSDVAKCIKDSGIVSGIVCVFVPHTTAGVSINENADPDVIRDVMFAMERAVPNADFLHSEGNSDAHTKAQLTGFSLNLIVEDARVILGTWQSIYFCEYDGPRQRQVYVKMISQISDKL